MQICTSPGRSMPRVYHLFNKETIPFKDVFKESKVEFLPLAEWRQSLKKVSTENPLMPLTPFMDSEFWDKSPQWPKFCTDNTDRYISDECRKLMPSSAELLPLYQDFFGRKRGLRKFANGDTKQVDR